MKKFLLIILMIVAFIPLSARADKYYDGYNTLDFKAALAEEGIKLENSSYKETDDQVIIYLFRGKGCGFCRKFLTFLSSISKDYGKYFKVVSFEVWNDVKNNELLNKMPNVTGVKAEGVPYVIIGSKVFDGYSESYDEDIKAQIMSEYKNKSEDVFEKLKQYDDGTFVLPDQPENEGSGNANNYSNTSSSGGSDTFAIIFWNFAFLAVATGIIVYLNDKNKKEILLKLEDLNTQEKSKNNKNKKNEEGKE